jgi:hypothetical protein
MMNFVLDKNDMEQIAIWDKNHKCNMKDNVGAIGGRITYSFTLTGLGTITKVKCACGEELDLTEYGEW